MTHINAYKQNVGDKLQAVKAAVAEAEIAIEELCSKAAEDTTTEPAKDAGSTSGQGKGKANYK